MPLRRALAGFLVATLPALGLSVVGASDATGSHRAVASAASSRAPSLAVAPVDPAPGERITLSGRLASRFARPAVLERRHAGRWRPVRSARVRPDGRFAVVLTAVRGSSTYRLRAPAARAGGRWWAAVTTAPRQVRSVAPTARLAAPSQVRHGRPAELVVRLTPHRPGRPLVVQERVAGRWVERTRRTSGRAPGSTTTPTPRAASPGPPGRSAWTRGTRRG